MTDVIRAKELLNEGNTCVLVFNDKEIISKKTGIAPMMDIIGNNINVSDFSVADKIVGKAAAMLFVVAGVKEIYAEVLSESAIVILEKYKIRYSYKTLTKRIINREGTDICPMEKCVQNIDEPNEAYLSLKAKICELKNTTW